MSTEIDFVMAAWREDGVWHVDQLPSRAGESLSSFVEACNAHPADAGVLGMVCVAEDFFVLARVQGTTTRYLLSDVGAAEDSKLAVEVIDALGVGVAEEADIDDIAPVGDLTIVADWGMSGAELSILCEDIDLYPDEVLGSVAARLGFGEKFDAALDAVDAGV